MQTINEPVSEVLIASAAHDYQHWYGSVPNHNSSQVIMFSSGEIRQLYCGNPVDIWVTIPYPVFVRLTSRSPKDYHTSGLETYDFNCFAECVEDIMKMILLSQRCRDDITDYYRASLPLGIVLQPFNNKIKLRNEYRLFVYRCELVAVSAVDEPNDRLSVDDLLQLKQYVESLVDLHTSFTEYVADVSMTRGLIVFIEINPYRPDITDSFLFDWEENDADRQLLFPETTPSVPVYRYE